MSLFERKKKQVELAPALMHEEDPVNYNSVLDYMVGLSKPEYDKIIKISGIYRNANQEAAKILGVKDTPTVTLKPEKPSDEEIDGALDNALAGIGYEPTDEDKAKEQKPKKPQATAKKIEIDQS